MWRFEICDVYLMCGIYKFIFYKQQFLRKMDLKSSWVILTYRWRWTPIRVTNYDSVRHSESWLVMLSHELWLRSWFVLIYRWRWRAQFVSHFDISWWMYLYIHIWFGECEEMLMVWYTIYDEVYDVCGACGFYTPQIDGYGKFVSRIDIQVALMYIYDIV